MANRSSTDPSTENFRPIFIEQGSDQLVPDNGHSSIIAGRRYCLKRNDDYRIVPSISEEDLTRSAVCSQPESIKGRKRKRSSIIDSNSSTGLSADDDEIIKKFIKCTQEHVGNISDTKKFTRNSLLIDSHKL
ncbi:MAG: hypothetical protein MHMPM18_004579, partial [Marteilia pararefringens]